MGLFNKKSNGDDGAGPSAAEDDVVRAVLMHSPPRTVLSFGAPTRCPTCGDFGFVESVQHGAGICQNHCFGCGNDWTITRRAIDAQSRIKADITVELADQLIPPPMLFRDGERVVDEPAPEPADLGRIDWGAGLAKDHATGDETRADATEHADVEVPGPVPTAPAAWGEPAKADLVERLVAEANRTREERELLGEDGPAAARPLRLLVIEDNPFDYAVLEMIFDEAGPSVVEVTHVETFAEGFDHSRNEPFDVILLDLNLPDSSGVSTLQTWQEATAARTPVIAMSSVDDPSFPSAARESGVAYFVRKTQIEELTYLDHGGADRFVQLLQTTMRKSRA